MKKFFIFITIISFSSIFFINLKPDRIEGNAGVSEHKSENRYYNIAGTVHSQDTMDAIFERHNLEKRELSRIVSTSKEIYNLSRLSPGSVYSFKIEKKLHTIKNMQYGIDDDRFLNITKGPEGYEAEIIDVKYTKKIGSLYINVNRNLANSMPNTHREYLKLALDLSSIFAWDIDFSNDIRNGDSVKLLVEELWVGEVFRGFGNILAAEFNNNGKVHTAYRFEYDGYVDYYDRNGHSLRKTLMKSPLKFRYISSGFSRKRFHPILRIYRPHLGVDYAAPTGTPVSAAGSGTVLYAGYKGQNGRMVKIRHRNGYVTYYGHLSKIPGKIRKGTKVTQGDIIGYVGSTGLSTGPHLDYRIKHNGRFINPLKLDLPRGKAVPEHLLARFRNIVDSFETRLVSIPRPIIASSNSKHSAG